MICASLMAPRQPANCSRHPKGGFTLLEMMLSLALFATGTLAAMELIHLGQMGSRDSEHTLVATYLAQQCMETARNVAYGSLDDATLAALSDCASSVSTLPSGSRSAVVTTPYTNLKKVVVTVTWTEQGGSTNVSMATYRSNV